MPTAAAIPYGSKLSESSFSDNKVVLDNDEEISGTFAWQDENKIVTSCGYYVAIFTPKETAKYETVTVKISVTVTTKQKSRSSNTQPATPTRLTDIATNIIIDISGFTLPAGVTAVSLNVAIGSENTDQQAADFSCALLADPKVGVIGSTVIYNMELLDRNGKVITGTGKIKLTLPVPAGLRGTPHVLRYEPATGTFTDLNAKLENGMLVFEANSLGYCAVAGMGDSIQLDTTSYTMPISGNYEIGWRLTGTRGTSVKVYSTNPNVASVAKLTNGNYRVTGRKTGTVYIMYDVYDNKNKLLSHASVRVDVKTGIRPRGDSTRQLGVF